MRLQRSLLLLGSLFIIVSFLNLGAGGSGFFVGPNSFAGMWVRTGGDFYLEVESTQNESISIYVLDYSNALIAIEELSVENTSPLVVFENLTQYSGTINILLPGTYAILVTSLLNDTSVSIHVKPVLPMLPFTYTGMGLCVVGGLISRVKKPRGSCENAK